jgi:hypothetical protein
MRFVAVSTIFAAVVTLAIHGVSASSVGTVKQTDQVNQGVSYLSKKEETTCVFEDGAKRISLEKKEWLDAIFTKLYGSDAGCQVTNALLRLSTPPKFSKLPGKDFRIDNKSSFDPLHPRRSRHPGHHLDWPLGFSPSLISTGKYSANISHKERRKLRATLTSIFNVRIGELIAKIVTNVAKPESIIKLFKPLDKSENIRRFLANIYYFIAVSGLGSNFGDGGGNNPASSFGDGLGAGLGAKA